MGFFSRFFSEEAGVCDAPVIADDESSGGTEPVAFDYLLAMMETGKL